MTERKNRLVSNEDDTRSHSFKAEERHVCIWDMGEKTGNTILKIKRTGEITQDKSRKVYE